MSNQTLNQVKKICQTYNIWPKRSQGQNFLINQEVLEKILETAEIKKSDTVLEVGPGLGILTEALLKKAKKVVSIELDQKLFRFLKSKFSGFNNLELINEDIFSWQAANPASYKVVANLPYNITSHFLKKFLTGRNRPKDMTLLLQKEVAQRICAKPGQLSLLAISVQLYGEPKIIDIVGKKNFWPQPEVDSAILKISNIKTQHSVDNFLQGVDEKKFWRIVKIGFSSKRKQLHNNLAAGLPVSSADAKKLLKKANFDPQIRAQNLSIKDWINLATRLDD